MSLKVASYNLLHPDYARNHPVTFLPDGGKNWGTRKAQAGLNISGADIVCLQECDKQMVESLKGSKQSFFAAHKGKPDGVGILVNPARFELLDIKTEYDGPTGHATIFIDLFDRTTRKTLRIASMHLKGGPVRTDGDNQLQGALKRIESEPSKQPIDATIIAGDFNQDQTPGPTSRLRFVTDYSLSRAVSETEIGKGRQIDWIGIKSKEAFKLEYKDAQSMTPASDHHPLLGLITFTPAAPAPLVMDLQKPAETPTTKSSEKTCSLWNLIMNCLRMKTKQE